MKSGVQVEFRLLFRTGSGQFCDKFGRSFRTGLREVLDKVGPRFGTSSGFCLRQVWGFVHDKFRVL